MTTSDRPLRTRSRVVARARAARAEELERQKQQQEEEAPEEVAYPDPPKASTAKYVRCSAYADRWAELGKEEGWLGCSLSKGHTGQHEDVGERLILPSKAPVVLDEQTNSLRKRVLASLVGKKKSRPPETVAEAGTGLNVSGQLTTPQHRQGAIPMVGEYDESEKLREWGDPVPPEKKPSKAPKVTESDRLADVWSKAIDPPAPVAPDLIAYDIPELALPTVLDLKGIHKAKRGWEKTHFLGWFIGCPVRPILEEQARISFLAGVEYAEERQNAKT
jgi:hypothetical protein